MAIDFSCLHCNAKVTLPEIKEGWCGSCGKKIPLSIQGEAKKQGSINVAAKDDYDEPKPGSGRRLLVAALLFVSVIAGAAALVAMKVV